MGTRTNRLLHGTYRSLEFKFRNIFKHMRTVHGHREHYTVTKNYRVVTLPFTPSVGWFCIEGVIK